MANIYNAVALFLGRSQHGRRLLLDKPQHYQLAIHRIPFRFRRCLPSYDLDPTHGWSTSRNHHSIRPDSTRELDTLCWHAHLTSQLRPHNVRSIPHRSGATVRPFGTHSVLRHLVYAFRPRFRYRDCLPRKPFRRRIGTTHQPLPSNHSF